MDIPTDLAIYQAVRKAILDLLSNNVKEAHFNGRGYTMQDLGTLREVEAEYKRRCEANGDIPAGKNAKIAYSQCLVWNPSYGYQ